MSFSEDQLATAIFCYENASEEQQDRLEEAADNEGMDVIDFLATELEKTDFTLRKYS
ncbi:hypothetical protein WN093_04400 [Gammaproteobacteria bacterium AS21]